MRLTKFVVEKQKRFFEKGKGNLISLKMTDAAEQMGLAVSTVSRTVRGKYLQCSHGIFPLPYFFPKGLEAAPGEQFTAEKMKMDIKRIIDSENKKKPLSDQKIADIMEKEGCALSRRTVAKYRAEMGILDARGRKDTGCGS